MDNIIRIFSKRKIFFWINYICFWKQIIGKTQIHIGGLFELGSDWNLTGVKIGAEVAIEHINANDNILKNYELILHPKNSKCTGTVATKVLLELVQTEPIKIILLGGGCSISVLPTAALAPHWNLNQVAYHGTSPLLSDRSVFPLLFRMRPPAEDDISVRVAFVKYFNWKRVALIYDEIDPYRTVSLTVVHRIHDKMEEAGIQVVASQGFRGNIPEKQMKFLKEQDARIILAFGFETQLRQIFCQAYHEKMFGPKYVWILQGIFSHKWYLKSDSKVNCTGEQMELAANFHFSLDAAHVRSDTLKTISNKTPLDVIGDILQRTNGKKVNGSELAGLSYDGIWAIAMALNKSIEKLHQLNSSKGIESFNYNNKELKDIIHESLMTLKFEGVTGPISFNENGDQVNISYVINYVKGGNEIKIGYFFRLDNSILFVVNISYLFGAEGVPQDGVLVTVEVRSLPIVVVIIICSFTTVGIISALALLLFNIKFRDKKIIKLSSPIMNNVILLGCLMTYVSVFFFVISDSSFSQRYESTFCMTRVWLLTLGFSMSFGGLFCKTWRVHKIMNASKPKRMVIKDTQLVGITCVLLFLDAIIMFAWELYSPIHKIMKALPEEVLPTADRKIKPYVEMCRGTSNIFLIIICVYKGFLLIYGVILSFQMRKVKIDELNDSKFIGFSIYNVLILLIVGVPVIIFTSSSTVAEAFIAAFIIVGTTITMCLVFIPKIIKFRKYPDTLRISRSNKGKASIDSVTRPNTETDTLIENLKALVLQQEEQIAALKQELQKKSTRCRESKT